MSDEPGLKVLSPGLHTTVQDLGRIGYQKIGVPVSGALDGRCFQLANALVGNDAASAALEILISGPILEIGADSARVALVGAGCSLGIRSEAGRVVAEGRSVTLSRGDSFQIVVGRQSACCYLAVAGGIAVPMILGSASTYVRAGFGGLQGRLLQSGDCVPLARPSAPEGRELRSPVPSCGTGDQPIRVVLGPQHEYFTQEAIAALLGAEFCVSHNADRMGMRLDGPLLRHRSGWDITSDAIATGSIQVPGSGQPIILLADHQTTGGYPKIATVVSADLPVIGRRRPGDVVRFVAVGINAAERLCREERRRFEELLAGLEAVPEPRLGFRSLYDQNLISGVVSGLEPSAEETPAEE